MTARPAIGHARRRRLPSVRARTALAAVVVVGATLVAGGAVFTHLLSASLTSGVDSSARLRVEAVANLLAGGTVPTTLAVPGDDSVLVQVVDSSGRVVAASDNVADERALVPATTATLSTATLSTATPTTGSTGLRVFTAHGLPVAEQGVFRVTVRAVATPIGTRTVVAAASLEPVRQTVAAMTAALAAGLPVVLILVGLTAWLLAGRALAPVESIRAQVAEISGQALDRRVPDPGGRDEIARLARTMNDMLGRLEQSQVGQRRFVANASHELRSPLSSALTQLQVDLAHPEGADWLATLTGVEVELERMQRMVVDLLALARADEGVLAAGGSEVSLDQLVRDEVDRQLITSPVVIDASERQVEPVRLHGNADALRRVVSNLIANATRHARTAVTVSLVAAPGVVVLTVCDDGPGIPPDQRERVFERFVRLDDARSRDDGGAGLGLAIVKETVEAHGGTVVIGDALPGARVEVRFPAPVVAAVRGLGTGR